MALLPNRHLCIKKNIIYLIIRTAHSWAKGRYCQCHRGGRWDLMRSRIKDCRIQSAVQYMKCLKIALTSRWQMYSKICSTPAMFAPVNPASSALRATIFLDSSSRCSSHGSKYATCVMWRKRVHQSPTMCKVQTNSILRKPRPGKSIVSIKSSANRRGPGNCGSDKRWS